MKKATSTTIYDIFISLTKAGTNRAIEYKCFCYLELLFVYIKLSTRIFKDNLF
jgi:hypothetical protein